MDGHDIPYLNELREQLLRGISAHVATQQRRRQRTHVAARIAVATATVAVAATAAVVFVGGSTTGSADAAILRHVRAAITPSATVVLHEKAVATLDGSRVDYESWQLSRAPYSWRRIKGPTEASYDGTTVESYDSATNTITEQPIAEPQAFDDPVAMLRQLLNSGDAHIVTTTTLNGRRVYEIVSHSSDAVLDGTVYVDATTYAPVRAELPSPAGCPGEDCAGPETIDFLAYEQLPATPENLKLLSVTALHPQAKVVAVPAAPVGTGNTSTTPSAKSGSSKPAASTSTSTNG